jgi:hypothetical protein
MPETVADVASTFTLRSEKDDDFTTGLTHDACQVVVGLLCPFLVAYFFEADGKWLRCEKQLWVYPAPRMREDGPYQIYDSAFQDALLCQQKLWMSRLGFQPGPIQIQEFFDKENWVGICRFPDFLEEDELDEEEQKDKDDWLARGDFVWWWAKDYHVSADGDIHSS